MVEERDRSTYIGASEAAAVVGLSRWDSPVGVWSRKVGVTTEEPTPPLRMWLGQRMEPILLELFTARTGLKPRAHQRLVVAKGIPYIGAHPDFYQLEVKTARNANGWGEDGAVVTEDDPSAIPIDYFLQVQHQLFCTGWDHSWVAVLIGHDTFRTYDVQRAPTIIEGLVAAEVELWEQNVLTGVPPAMDDSDAARDWLRSRFPRDTEPLRVATPEEAMLIDEAYAANALAAEADKRAKALKHQLELAIGNARGLTSGRLRATWSAYDKKAYVVAAHSGRTLRFARGKDDDDE